MNNITIIPVMKCISRINKKSFPVQWTNKHSKHIFFEVRHPCCVSTKSNYKVYAYIVKHNYILGGMLFTICKAQLHVSATNVGHLQVVR
jgi:hypothetical protein